MFVHWWERKKWWIRRTSRGPALAPWTTTMLSLPCTKLLNTLDIAESPAGEPWGTRRPTSERSDVEVGARVTTPVLETGAIMTSPTNVSKPIELSSIPTWEGCMKGFSDCGKIGVFKLTFVVLASKVRWMPPAGSFDGRSKVLIFTPSFKPLKPFSVTVFVVRVISETCIPVSLIISLQDQTDGCRPTQSADYIHIPN